MILNTFNRFEDVFIGLSYFVFVIVNVFKENPKRMVIVRNAQESITLL